MDRDNIINIACMWAILFDNKMLPWIVVQQIYLALVFSVQPWKWPSTIIQRTKLVFKMCSLVLTRKIITSFEMSKTCKRSYIFTSYSSFVDITYKQMCTYVRRKWTTRLIVRQWKRAIFLHTSGSTVISYRHKKIYDRCRRVSSQACPTNTWVRKAKKTWPTTYLI